MGQTNKLNWLVPGLLLCNISISSFSQTLKDVFSKNKPPLTYLGIDFSKSKLLDEGDPAKIREFYGAINTLIIKEPQKYDLKSAFHNKNIDHDFDAVTKNNAKADLNEILSTKSSDFNRLKASDVTTMVNDLDLSGKQGIGLLFVMEAMRKMVHNSSAAIWVTLIDMKTKEILMTERIESKATRAIGFRNYWASTINYLLNHIAVKKYKKWKKKYAK